MRTSNTCFWPFIFTVTIPPPAEASTATAFTCCCKSSCTCRKRESICCRALTSIFIYTSLLAVRAKRFRHSLRDETRKCCLFAAHPDKLDFTTVFCPTARLRLFSRCEMHPCACIIRAARLTHPQIIFCNDSRHALTTSQRATYSRAGHLAAFRRLARVPCSRAHEITREIAQQTVLRSPHHQPSSGARIRPGRRVAQLAPRTRRAARGSGQKRHRSGVFRRRHP